MPTHIAIAHISGAVFALLVFGVLCIALDLWAGQRYRQRLVEDFALRIGVSVEEVESDTYWPRCEQLLAERWSSELLGNRIADACGIVRTLWNCIDWLTTAGILAATVWFTAEENSNALFAWAAPAATVFFAATRMLFSSACRILTGRYPGEPSKGRAAVLGGHSQRFAAAFSRPT